MSVRSYDSQEVWGNAVSSPFGDFGVNLPKILAKILFKRKKIVYSLTFFGVRFKQIITLITFTDSLKNVPYLLNQFFFAKRSLLFHIKNVRNVLRSKKMAVSKFGPIVYHSIFCLKTRFYLAYVQNLHSKVLIKAQL